MSKRNFEELEVQHRSHDQHTPPPKQHRVQGVLDNGKTTLFQALKVARGFERQKLGRRHKKAKKDKNEADTTRLDTEIITLKNLDLAKTAELHLCKTLLRIKSIASSPSLPKNIQASVDATHKPQNAASANVQARLFNSVPAKTAMLNITNSVRATLNLAEDKERPKKRLRARDYTDGNDDALSVQESTKAPHTKAQASGHEARVLLDLESEEEDEIEGSDSDSISYKLYTSRIAASLSSSCSTTLEHANRQSDASWSGFSDPDDPQPVLSDNDDSPKATVNQYHSKSKPRVSKVTDPPKSTTFLPTLSMGGYWSGSDSNGEEIDDTVAQIQARKNKRGQRERRMIAEKKFGRNANHLKNAAQDQRNDFDPRTGARSENHGGKNRRVTRRRDIRTARANGRGPTSSGANSDPVKPRMKKNVEQGPLHPSWEAAKRAKEQKLAVEFKGKKITFD